MRQSITRKLWVMGALSFWLVTAGVHAAQLSYSQVVDGVAVYFGMMPAELVRGHPREHPEGVMHGGVVVGESHLTVAVFDDKTGRRISDAEVTAHITGDRGLTAQKRLDLMVIAGSATYGNYFSMPGSGPYRIEVRIRLPGKAREVRAVFTWARS